MTNSPLWQPTSETEDKIFFTNLRVDSWEDFIGQEKVKKSLKISLSAAKKRSENLDHILFYGPPGLGKTTMSHLVAQELSGNLKVTSGTALTKPGDLAAILTSLSDHDVLFIDEIHRLPIVIEEALYPAMEDFCLDIVIGKGAGAKTLRLDLPKFCLIGATTKFGSLSGPFRDRFGLIHKFDSYSVKDLTSIILKAAKKLKVNISDSAANQLAHRSRYTPRIALKLLKRVRDFSQSQDLKTIDEKTIKATLAYLEIDQLGLDQTDRDFLKKIIDLFEGGPVGLNTLSAIMNEDAGTIEEVLEPFLLQAGLLERTNRGRVVSQKAYQHLKMQLPEKK